MSNDDQANAVRQRMAELRREVGGDVEQLSHTARAMADWRYYAKRFPWATVALAAAAGYLIVPSRPRIISPNADTLVKLAKKNKLIVTQKPESQNSEGLFGRLASMAALGLARAGIAYVGHALGTSSTSTANSAQNAGPMHQEEAMAT